MGLVPHGQRPLGLHSLSIGTGRFFLQIRKMNQLRVYHITDTHAPGLTGSSASVTKGWGKNRKFLLCAGVALGLLTPATGAWAQGGNPPPTPAPPPAPSRVPAPTPPPASTPPPEAEPKPQPGQDDIVVTAPTQQSSSDRQT